MRWLIAPLGPARPQIGPLGSVWLPIGPLGLVRLLIGPLALVRLLIGPLGPVRLLIGLLCLVRLPIETVDPVRVWIAPVGVMRWVVPLLGVMRLTIRSLNWVGSLNPLVGPMGSETGALDVVCPGSPIWTLRQVGSAIPLVGALRVPVWLGTGLICRRGRRGWRAVARTE
ncbi:hypothetical protein ITP53_21670 [Nonomuraea sp. K274]|uniref:Uncharacterized protein n=1 Tax=Nonomuraea cypriaca TaxID=1187855 RepID=A0A931A8F0_9ACTN|nr:hypothetical protein [Nonomuraea cypriaca]MBF8188292.1 hypothetical protein [Nonomuraea cypriaca]